jgi:hypothetical protein
VTTDAGGPGINGSSESDGGPLGDFGNERAGCQASMAPGSRLAAADAALSALAIAVIRRRRRHTT